MKILPAVLLALVMAAAAVAADSEIAVFDEAQSAFSRFEESEIAAWRRIDPQIAAFHEEWRKLNEFSRKRNRLVFLYKLRHKPDSIHWESWKGWLRPIESPADAESCKSTVPGFRDITAAFEKRKKLSTARNDLLVKRNALHDKNRDVSQNWRGPFPRSSAHWRSAWPLCAAPARNGIPLRLRRPGRGLSGPDLFFRFDSRWGCV